MSILKVDKLHSEDGANSNIELDDSRHTTCKGNLTVDGTTTLTGAVTLPAGTTSDTKSFRNLIINGAMQVAQRSSSSTDNGYGSLDRFALHSGGTDEAPTHAQITLTSSDTGPWGKGFSKALQVTNGNQTSGAGAADSMELQTILEGQDVHNSGWVPTDPNSKLTISYWAKSSVAQTFYFRFRAFASSEYEYTYSVALSANTWTKVTETIPGNSNFSSLVATNAKGFFHSWALFNGTDQTNNKTLDAWAVKDNANKSPDCTSTWYTTNDATFAITGVQLEVGDTATDFEHRSYGEELSRCHRYCQMDSATTSGHQWHMYGQGYSAGATYAYINVELHTPMRVIPSLVEKGLDAGSTSSSGNGALIEQVTTSGISNYAVSSANVNAASTPQRIMVYVGHDTSGSQAQPCGLVSWNNQTSYLLLSAEL